MLIDLVEVEGSTWVKYTVHKELVSPRHQVKRTQIALCKVLSYFRIVEQENNFVA